MESNQEPLALRDRAIKQIKKKREFSAHLLAYVLVNSLLIVIWAMSGADTIFWPIFSIGGWGIGLVFHWWDVYRGEPTEDEIQREMSRMNRPR